MWSFVIYDKSRGPGNEKLFMARDRVGEKPFYYRYKNDIFEFSSELKGLGGNPNFDFHSLNAYLSLGYVPGHLCIMEGVHKLPPAHAGMLCFKNRKFHTWQYWKLPSLENVCENTAAPQTIASDVWELLKQSVRLRLRSDVPTGIFLSGGLDSSLITAAASIVSDSKIKTFTVAQPTSSLDESRYAKIIADHYGTEHEVLQMSRSSNDLFDELSPFIDEPIADTSILPSFLVSKLTAKYVKVALGGDGGDELFGGYSGYQNLLKSVNDFNWVPSFILKNLGMISSQLPAGVKGRNTFSSIRYGPKQKIIWSNSYFDPSLRKRIFSRDVYNEIRAHIESPEFMQLGVLNSELDAVNGMTRMDFLSRLPDCYLVKVDRASMASSLEVRVPWLDVNLIEYAFSKIPASLKCTIKDRRIIQNILAKEHLPKNFKTNRKQGFSFPFDDWIKGQNIHKYLDALPPSIFNFNEIDNLVLGQKNGRKNGSRIFALMMLNLFVKNFSS
jgi:asparagine synthase (glutamine-hydrolysing)